MPEYELTWRMSSSSPTPETEYNAVGREEAVIQMLEDAGVDTESVTYQHPPRHLSGYPGPVFTVGSLLIDNIESLVIIYQFLRNRGDSEAQLDEEDVEELIEQKLVE